MEKNAVLKEESPVRNQENQHCQFMKFAINNFATGAMREGQCNTASMAKFTYGRVISQAPATATGGQVHKPTITIMTEGQEQTSTMKRGQNQILQTKIMTGRLEQAKTLKTKREDQGIFPTLCRQTEKFGQTRAKKYQKRSRENSDGSPLD
ncbi:hypothetical protein CHS0354_015590 [Potamilus streckersoni]|uniref:Uncharacterized protein n=1 Tax=Potamilus streckersoni TaxID=2493646 RepID=A0AAE0TCW5_9BIVA|nr:hypothetical protein CHS0354_015590 [Potamilus streckersoni]